jgi:hypothetical protein
MIVVYIKPTGIERVFFHAESDLVEDSCLAAWPIIRKELKRLDKKLHDGTAQLEKSLKRLEQSYER